MTKDQELEVWLRVMCVTYEAHPTWGIMQAVEVADNALAHARQRFGSSEGRKHQETIG